jgi:ArsR family transcriptional regulator
LKAEELVLAASMLKSLAHPLRIRICKLLGDKELSVNEILQTMPMEQAVLSQHLTLMKRKHILQSRRDGQRILYSVQSRSVLDILSCMEKCIKKNER